MFQFGPPLRQPLLVIVVVLGRYFVEFTLKGAKLVGRMEALALKRLHRGGLRPQHRPGAALLVHVPGHETGEIGGRAKGGRKAHDTHGVVGWSPPHVVPRRHRRPGDEAAQFGGGCIAAGDARVRFGAGGDGGAGALEGAAGAIGEGQSLDVDGGEGGGGFCQLAGIDLDRGSSRR